LLFALSSFFENCFEICQNKNVIYFLNFFFGWAKHTKGMPAATQAAVPVFHPLGTPHQSSS
jgi:hypothetical protein